MINQRQKNHLFLKFLKSSQGDNMDEIPAEQLGEGVKFEHDYKDESGENFAKVKNEYKE